MRPLTLAILASLALVSLAPPATAGAGAAWKQLPPGLPADSCMLRLRAWEGAPPAPLTAADAAMALGQMHYARGEYRQAGEAFLRAASRSTGEAHAEARYWTGIAALATGNAGEARAAFGDALEGGTPAQRPLAQLGLAQAWDLERRPEKAFDVLHQLLAADPGEAGPAALERYATLAEQFHRTDEARKARQRLAREYPASVEAARLAAAAAEPPAAGPVGVQIGVFADRERATALLADAKRAGFASAQVLERKGEGARPTLWVVKLGTWANRDEANAAGEKAQRALGVGWQVMAP